MTKLPEISIITPVRNSVGHIGRCIENVINQGCTVCEHIIVDGGSDDGTLDVIKQYAMKYEHIRYISERDSGQSEAMNKGVRMARGKFVGFLNADDYYEGKVLDRVLAILRTLAEPAFLVGNCNVWSARRSKTVNRPQRLELDDLLMGFDINPFPVNPSAYFYSTSLHGKIGYFDEHDHYAMDLDFILRAARAVKPTHVDEIWGNYWLDENAKTFQEVKSGRSVKRNEALMQNYFLQLPLWRQIKIKSVRSVSGMNRKLQYYGARLGHYLRKPGEAAGLVRRKMHSVKGQET